MAGDRENERIEPERRPRPPILDVARSQEGGSGRRMKTGEKKHISDEEGKCRNVLRYNKVGLNKE